MYEDFMSQANRNIINRIVAIAEEFMGSDLTTTSKTLTLNTVVLYMSTTSKYNTSALLEQQGKKVSGVISKMGYNVLSEDITVDDDDVMYRIIFAPRP